MIDIYNGWWQNDEASYDRFAISVIDHDNYDEVFAFKSVDDVLYSTYSDAEQAAYEMVIRVATESKDQERPFIAMMFDIRDISVRRAKRVDAYA